MKHQHVKMLAAALAGFAALATSGAANAQRLDRNDCNNALYHFEDANVSPAHLSTLLSADSREKLFTLPAHLIDEIGDGVLELELVFGPLLRARSG